jgi:hypothetical protein
VLIGAASVVSVDEDPAVLDAEVELFVADPDEVVVLLPDEQPATSIPATSIAATNHRRVM